MKRTALLMLLLLTGFAAAAGAQGRRAAPDWVDPTSGRQRADFIVYYFHNEFRCQTCLAMEAEAETAVRDDFAAELESGVIAWQTINLQNPENEHFTAHYSLDGPSVVMVQWGENEEVRWKNLERTWELIDTPQKYRAYVSAELAAWLQDPETGEDE